MTQIKITADKNSLINEASNFIIEKIKSAIALNHICSIALAGGGTPKPIYENIAKTEIEWSKLHVFWGDERYVPSNHPDSNEKMAREAWLNQVNIPNSNIHPMPTTGDNPTSDAEKYQEELLHFFQVPPQEVSFDIILLGMGDDGHTASLFPHTQALKECDRIITVGNKGDSQRLTFTASLINQAKLVIFLVSGENKQEALEAVFSESADSSQYPSKLIKPQGELIWFIDEAAAVKINP
jgi:6-phosphogluconolactonase